MIKAEVKVDDGNDDTELLSELVSLSNIEDGTVQIFIKFVLLVSFLSHAFNCMRPIIYQFTG